MATIACGCHVHDRLLAVLLDSARYPESSRAPYRDPGSPASAPRIATIERQPPTAPELCWPTSVGLALTTLKRLAICPDDHQSWKSRHPPGRPITSADTGPETVIAWRRPKGQVPAGPNVYAFHSQFPRYILTFPSTPSTEAGAIMRSVNLEKAALNAREAYSALSQLKTLVESVANSIQEAERKTVGLS